MSAHDPWGGSWGLHWEGWYQPESGAHAITGAGGIASAEAVGAPVIDLVSASYPVRLLRLGGPGRAPVAAHVIYGAGGIASAEAFGTPILVLPAKVMPLRSRRVREAEMMMIEELERLAA